MINGISGCSIAIDSKTIIKSAISYPKDRLIKQGYKQQQFYHPKIYTPQIFNIANDHISMAYINGYNFLDFCDKYGPEYIIGKFKIVIDYIQQNIRETIELDRIIIIDKIKEIESKTSLKLDIRVPKHIVIPAGYCHGDLTLSNILIEKDTYNIFYIDFLDSFIESPLIDIVKLRQDTQFLWSVNLFNHKTIDIIRIKLIFGYLDQYLHNYFVPNDWYKINYTLFQQLNLARTLPYIKNLELQKQIYEYINTPSMWPI